MGFANKASSLLSRDLLSLNTKANNEIVAIVGSARAPDQSSQMSASLPYLYPTVVSSAYAASTYCPEDACQVLKAASILNNTAIRLLERQEYPQALRRFQQATQMLKDLAGHLDGVVTVIPQDPCDKLVPTSPILPLPPPPLVTTRVTAAGGGSSCPMTPPSCTSAGETMELPVGPTMCSISTEFDPSSFHNALASSTSTTASNEFKVTFFPFFMDLSTCNIRSLINDDSAPLDVDFYSSVVLYNYAIAYQSFAQTVTTVTAAAYFHRKAQRILSLSSYLLDLQLRDELGLPKIQCTDGRTMQLQAFVTYQLMQMCAVFDLAVDYYCYCAKLEEILLSIDTLERLLTTRDYCAAVA
jgi:hypothetical protein